MHGKKFLHRWLAGLERLELAAALQLLVISLVLLPVLPDRGFGPGAVLNPFKIWLMVVLISGLSFIGYIACKLAGPRLGLVIVGLLGGLASSTAVTLSFSRLARRSPEIGTVLVGGIAMASVVMFLRVLVLVQIFQPGLLIRLAPSTLVMAAICLVCGLVLSLRRRTTASTVPGPDLADPSELATAVGFGVLLALVLLVSYLVDEWIGHDGVYAVAAVSGLVDVDAFTLSMSELSGSEGFLPSVAANAIVLAVLTNSASKLAIVIAVAGGAAARSAALVFGLVIAGGLAAWALL
jgi:uncharacterized membrane protein (DUF4010 family)